MGINKGEIMPKLNNAVPQGKTGTDEMYTPKLMVDPIINHIPPGARIWCPFDEENSEFVLTMKENKIDVTYSHIKTGQDFFKYEPFSYDMIISNGPFSMKKSILERLYDLKVPFAVIFGMTIINYQEIGHFFYKKNSDVQFMIFDKKVSFNGGTSSFNCSYFCRDFLPQQVKFEHLPHNNSMGHYVPSRMHGGNYNCPECSDFVSRDRDSWLEHIKTVHKKEKKKSNND